MLTVIGEALIDEVVRPDAAAVPYVGGSPVNVAVGLARLGLPTRYFGRWGKDEYGGRIAEHLSANSVLAGVEADDAPTSVARAELDDDGAATYRFSLDWELPQLRAVDLADSTWLHIGSIGAMLEPGADQVFEAVVRARPHASISYDPNCRPAIVPDAGYARAQAERFVALADVVKASDEDLAWLYPGVPPDEVARGWLAAGPAIVVITHGSDGAWAVCAAGEGEAAPEPVTVVDTVGAGDSFMSALIGALVERELDGAARRDELAAISVHELCEVLRFAATAAAITVSRAGANPPSRQEIRRPG